MPEFKMGLVDGPSTDEPGRVWDLVVAGGGPAGMSAAIYAARYSLETLVLEGMEPGGQLSLTARIENYPGVPETSGADLASAMRKQVLDSGSTLRSEVVRSVEDKGGKGLVVSTDSAEYAARCLMIATGAAPRRLGVPGEERLHGRGVSYCATCDAPFFRDAHVMVVGGGDSAVKEAMHLADFADRVTLIHRRDELRAEPILARRIQSREGVEILWSTTLEEILGDDSVEGVILSRDGDRQRMDLDGVFLYVGRSPATAPFRGLVELADDGTVLTRGNVLTSHPGVVAAGDVTDNPLRQIVTAVGDGARAATAVYEKLKG
ncbi:MAG: NAD(P)/FAD-dependent oxidoreductase [Candidatus Fermentibacterota bacterium]